MYRIRILSIDFAEEGKTGESGENPLGKGQEQTIDSSRIYDIVFELVGGQRSHYCANPYPQASVRSFWYKVTSPMCCHNVKNVSIKNQHMI